MTSTDPGRTPTAGARTVLGPLPAPAAAARRRRLPFRAADGRGLTAFGAVLLTLLTGAVGAVVDLSSRSSLGTWFAVGFIGGCLLSVLLVHREDLRAVVVMPPLVYVVLALGGGLAKQNSASGSLVTRQAVQLVNSVVLGAPILLIAAGATAVLAVVRAMGSRR